MTSAAAIFAAAIPAWGQPSTATQSAETLDREIEVPLNHAAPAQGNGRIVYECGAPFDVKKPTVFVLADAQQFFLTRGAVARIQRDSFGPEFNVVGVIGRGQSETFRKAAMRPDGTIDWSRAWQVFRGDQWVGDLEAVRRELLGPNGKVMLYGASGGGFLAVEYLALHGDHVSRAFIAASIAPFIVGEAGLCSDHFWDDVSHDAEILSKLKAALARHAKDRAIMVQTLQRQNFFVPADKLGAERTALIRALANDDEAAFSAARQRFQVDAVRAFYDSPMGVAIRVREFEFLYPTHRSALLHGDALYPDLEVQYEAAKPLMDLAETGAISVPPMRTAGLHACDGEVFMLSARHDHTTDYRSSIALANSFPHHALFIADDNHTFERLQQHGHYQKVSKAFLLHGLGSKEMTTALRDAAGLRWIER